MRARARLGDRMLTSRPRIIVKRGFLVVERRAWVGNEQKYQADVAWSLPEAFGIAHGWIGESK